MLLLWADLHQQFQELLTYGLGVVSVCLADEADAVRRQELSVIAQVAELLIVRFLFLCYLCHSAIPPYIKTGQSRLLQSYPA